jgi:predicted P-loop ATPase
VKKTSQKNVWSVINSDFSPLYNPFLSYLNRLPPWDGESNPILDLSMSVTVRGGTEEQLLFYLWLRKWLVGMVAGWIDDKVVNEVILVLIGRQGSYKTTWFNALLPPALESYFHSNTSFGQMTKDEVLKLSYYGLICCEELDAMKSPEMNRLKWAVTTRVTDERKPYAHASERRKHIASYCGTGNNVQFINDVTGTRRWLPFEVERISSPRDHPFDCDAIFAQAYALYLKGFRYWFNDAEMQLLARHNERFEVSRPERELIGRYYRLPKEGEPGVFVTNTEILQTVGGPLTLRLTSNGLGRAMTALGFRRVRSHGERGYNVVAYTDVERKANRSMLACDARAEAEAATVTLEEMRDTFDTLF